MSDIADLIAGAPEEDFVQEISTEIFASDQIREELLDYITTELEEVASDAGRGIKIERNKTISRQRLGRPESDTKNFPWENSSNIEPPFSLQKINTIVTKLVQSYLSKDPTFTYTADEPYGKHAEAVTRHVQKLMKSPYAIDFKSKLWAIMYDCVSYGTQFVKVPFDIKRMKFNRLDASGSTETVDRIIKASPGIKPIAFEDFLTRAEWTDIQTAPWIATRYHMHTHELKRLQQQGFYTNVDQIINEQAGLDSTKTEKMLLSGIETVGAQSEENYWYDIFEVNVFWDVDGDGFDEDVILHVEKSTKTILRAEYNDLGIRDYVRIPYIDIPGVLYGMGVGDIMIPLQEEAASLHNLRNDSMQLSAMPFIVTSSASEFGQKIELYPGKIIRTPNPREDVVTHKFPSAGTETLAAEALLKEYADNATGASDILSGQDVGGYNRIGSTGTQFLAGQSNGFLDSLASNIANQLSNVGMIILFQLVRNSDFITLDDVDTADRVLLEQVYAMNVEDIPTKFKFEARVSAIEDSRQAKQQEALTMMQIYTMYGDKMTQIMMQLDNPQLQQAPRAMDSLSSYAVGYTAMMEEALGSFTDDPGDFLPFVGDIKQSLSMQDAMKAQQLSEQEGAMNDAQVGAIDQAVQTDGGTGGMPSDVQAAGPGDVQGVQIQPNTAAELGGEPI